MHRKEKEKKEEEEVEAEEEEEEEKEERKSFYASLSLSLLFSSRVPYIRKQRLAPQGRVCSAAAAVDAILGHQTDEPFFRERTTVIS
jgi:hypothetical protein